MDSGRFRRFSRGGKWRWVLPVALVTSVFSFTSPSSIVFAQEIVNDPIVVIPGITASFNLDILLNPFPSPDINGWGFVPGTKYYVPLIDALEDKGLIKNKDFFIAHYDWRRNNRDSARDYLVPVIDKALAHSTTGKVDIVAHSMGGLVARAYIQSDGYRNDVD
jgi:pimeloyl-ACP methyl ester carboxylesterase